MTVTRPVTLLANERRAAVTALLYEIDRQAWLALR
jgi:hypothetical protein